MVQKPCLFVILTGFLYFKANFFSLRNAPELSYFSEGEKVSLILDWKTGTDSCEPYSKSSITKCERDMYSALEITVSDIKSLFRL